jgi:hypothetical protein
LKKFSLATVVVATALAVLLPVSSASAAIPGSHIAVAAIGSVTGVENPNPADPFAVSVVPVTTGTFNDLQMAGVFTRGTAVCAGVVGVDGSIPFTTVSQNFLTGYGTIGTGTFAGAGQAQCVGGATPTGTLADGAFVRAGTVAIAQFRLTDYLGGPRDNPATDVVATFVGTAVPGGPPCAPGAIQTCSGIAGPVVG